MGGRKRSHYIDLHWLLSNGAFFYVVRSFPNPLKFYSERFLHTYYFLYLSFLPSLSRSIRL